MQEEEKFIARRCFYRILWVFLGKVTGRVVSESSAVSGRRLSRHRPSVESWWRNAASRGCRRWPLSSGLSLG